jgi:hypothetical protein
MNAPKKLNKNIIIAHRTLFLFELLTTSTSANIGKIKKQKKTITTIRKCDRLNAPMGLPNLLFVVF